jgi:hypothetical protein
LCFVECADCPRLAGGGPRPLSSFSPTELAEFLDDDKAVADEIADDVRDALQYAGLPSARLLARSPYLGLDFSQYLISAAY